MPTSARACPTGHCARAPVRAAVPRSAEPRAAGAPSLTRIFSRARASSSFSRRRSSMLRLSRRSSSCRLACRATAAPCNQARSRGSPSSRVSLPGGSGDRLRLTALPPRVPGRSFALKSHATARDPHNTRRRDAWRGGRRAVTPRRAGARRRAGAPRLARPGAGALRLWGGGRACSSSRPARTRSASRSFSRSRSSFCARAGRVAPYPTYPAALAQNRVPLHSRLSALCRLRVGAPRQATQTCCARAPGRVTESQGRWPGCRA
jgi:hypothetical protein